MPSHLKSVEDKGSDSGRYRSGAFLWPSSSLTEDQKSFFSFSRTHYSPTQDPPIQNTALLSANTAIIVSSQYSQSIDEESILFSRLVEQWREERGITSSLSEMFKCPSYQEIIEMGERAVSLILDQIVREENDPDHWYAALEAITGEDPVPEDAYGDTVKIAEAWLSWAEGKNGWYSVECEPAESEF